MLSLVRLAGVFVILLSANPYIEGAAISKKLNKNTWGKINNDELMKYEDLLKKHPEFLKAIKEAVLAEQLPCKGEHTVSTLPPILTNTSTTKLTPGIENNLKTTESSFISTTIATILQTEKTPITEFYPEVSTGTEKTRTPIPPISSSIATESVPATTETSRYSIDPITTKTPPPIEYEPTTKQTEPTPKQTEPTPKQTEPTPKQTERTPEETEPTPEETEPTPLETEPTTEETKPTPKETEPVPSPTTLKPKVTTIASPKTTETTNSVPPYVTVSPNVEIGTTPEIITVTSEATSLQPSTEQEIITTRSTYKPDISTYPLITDFIHSLMTTTKPELSTTLSPPTTTSKVERPKLTTPFTEVSSEETTAEEHTSETTTTPEYEKVCKEWIFIKRPDPEDVSTTTEESRTTIYTFPTYRQLTNTTPDVTEPSLSVDTTTAQPEISEFTIIPGASVPENETGVWMPPYSGNAEIPRLSTKIPVATVKPEQPDYDPLIGCEQNFEFLNQTDAFEIHPCLMDTIISNLGGFNCKFGDLISNLNCETRSNIRDSLLKTLNSFVDSAKTIIDAVFAPKNCEK